MPTMLGRYRRFPPRPGVVISSATRALLNLTTPLIMAKLRQRCIYCSPPMYPPSEGGDNTHF